MNTSTKKPRILVATPAYNNQVYASFVTCLLQLSNKLGHLGIVVNFTHTVNSSLITRARNILVQRFLNEDHTHLLFIDGDMTFRPDDIVRMLEADKDVIGAVYPNKVIDWPAAVAFARSHPDAPVGQVQLASATFATYNPKTLPDDLSQPFEVESIGTAIMLIKRSVFEVMRGDASHRIVLNGMTHGEEVFFDTAFTQDGKYLGEDIAFCHKWRRLGGRVFAAAWCRVGHIGNHEHIGYLPGIK